jgi:hypothetical protein
MFFNKKLKVFLKTLLLLVVWIFILRHFLIFYQESSLFRIKNTKSYTDDKKFTVKGEIQVNKEKNSSRGKESINSEKIISVISDFNFNKSKQFKQILLLQKNQNIEKILVSLRIKYRVKRNIGNYLNKTSLIIFDNTDSYFKYKNLINDQIGVIVLNSKSKSNQNEIFISNCYLIDEFLNEFLIITKFNKESIKINKTIKFDEKFNDLFYNVSKYDPKSILKCENKETNQVYDFLFTIKINQTKHVFISYDNFDNIWLLKPLFLDSIKYLSNNLIEISPRRYVLVDIDDVFLNKVNSSDVLEMVRLQDKLTKSYFNHNEYKFKLNLGFNGKKFNNNNNGDTNLISKSFS